MSLCTWATVVSTVPSQALETTPSGQQGCSSRTGTAEPVPLPIFLSFLELLEKMNQEEIQSSNCNGRGTDQFLCQESSEQGAASTDSELEIAFDVDSFLNADIFESDTEEGGGAGNLDSNVSVSGNDNGILLLPESSSSSTGPAPGKGTAQSHRQERLLLESATADNDCFDHGMDCFLSPWSPGLVENLEHDEQPDEPELQLHHPISVYHSISSSSCSSSASSQGPRGNCESRKRKMLE